MALIARSRNLILAASLQEGSKRCCHREEPDFIPTFRRSGTTKRYSRHSIKQVKRGDRRGLLPRRAEVCGRTVKVRLNGLNSKEN